MGQDILSAVSLSLSLFCSIFDAFHTCGVKTSADLDLVTDSTDQVELGG